MYSERKRQIEHIVPVALAVLLRWFNVWAALACAFLGILYALFVSRRLVKGTFRPVDEARGYSQGKLIYGLMVFLLIAVFHQKMHVVSGAWALLALGDGCSTLVGIAYGAAKLPWNRDKSWAGTLAFFVLGALGSFAFCWFVAGRYGELAPSVGRIALATCVAAFLCAALESLPLKLDDNISVPALGACVLYAML
ncbi:MAG: hypothetical protein FJ279_07155 [Planctomycetes bacterium]|nr:hypothetical protein [Planctomycetota bacterium]